MKITHKIDIHLDNYRPTPEIVVMQCDANTRELQFMLYSNDAAWLIPESAKIYVGYSKPDGTGGFYDTLPDGTGACTSESNMVTAVLAEQVLTVPGKVFVSVSLQEEGQILATFAVQLNVKPKPGIAVMQSENYFCLKALIDAATVAAQKPVQVITVSENADGGYVSSHYLSGIQSIINLQLPVACHWYEQDVTLCLVEYQNGGPFTFAAVSNAIEYRVVIKSDEDISCTMTELVRSDKIPVTSVNGQTGAVAVSTAIKVEVWQKNDGSYDYSHNSLRIMNVLSAGNTVFCQLGTHYLLSLVYATPAKCIFTGVYEGELYAVTVTSTGATVTTTPLSSGGGGADGITPHIGANGNWWIGEEDTGVSATGGSGLSDTEKGLILSLFKSAVYSSDMSATITQLESLWGGSGDVPVEPDEPDEPDEPETITYTVTNNLTGVTNSNSATTVNKGESYSATLTIVEGYTWESVVITMGGVDITDTAYGDGYITIYEVSGDIVITAIAILPAPVYELVSVLECDGTQEPVDTGVILMDEQDEAFTIMIDYEVPETGCNGYVFGCPANGVLENQKYLYLDTGRWYGNVSHNALYFSAGLLYMREPAPINKVKLVLTHTPGETQINTYYMLNENGEKQTALVKHGGINVFGKATMSPLLLAALEFKGTINRFKIYDRVVTENEITEFLGVE